jgi:hypothetical protein
MRRETSWGLPYFMYTPLDVPTNLLTVNNSAENESRTESLAAAAIEWQTIPLLRNDMVRFNVYVKIALTAVWLAISILLTVLLWVRPSVESAPVPSPQPLGCLRPHVLLYSRI